MKSILSVCAIVILLFQNAWATDYYVSSSGNDSRSAAEATNPATPWKTINKINSYFVNFKPGDRILFKRGETFYGTLRITKSGTSSAPITFGAYGTGNRPVLTGFTTLSSWAPAGTGVYESYNASLGTELNMVLWNGKVQQIGRYPNANATNKGYLILETAGSTSITDNQLTGSWTGGEVVIRSSHWTLDRRKITSHSGTTINFSSALTYTVKPKFGYFIQGHLKTLDQAGEWYYNASTKKVYLYTGGSTPTGVKASALNNVVYLYKQHYINFSELRFEGGNTETVHINGATNINMNGCEVHFSGVNGVRTTASKSVKFMNGIVTESNNNAFDFRNSVSYSTISGNVIKNSGSRAGMGLSHNDTYQAIILNGESNHLIEKNSIENTGYIAIRFNGNYVTVKNNYINTFCNVKDDGAGVYTKNVSKTIYTQRKIIGNIILNGIGANEGTDKAGYYPAEGVYADDHTNNVEINGNTIANCNKGIYIHNGNNLKVQNNTLFNNTIQLAFSHDQFGDPIRNAIVTQNTMVSKLSDQLVSSIKSIIDDIPQMGRFDSNYYCRPIDDRMVIFSSYKNSSGTRFDLNQDLTAWQTKYSEDPKSKKSPSAIPQYKINSLVGSSKVANGTFNSNTSGFYGSSSSVAWSGASMLDGGHAQVTVPSTSSKSNIGVSVGAVSSGKNYILRFSAKGSSNNIDLAAFLRQGPSPYAALTPMHYRKVTTARNEYEIFFSAPTTSSATTLMIMCYTPNVKYYIDNVQLFEASVTPTNPDDYIKFEVNPTDASKTVSLSGTYVDIKNKSYSSSITLAPYTSAVLIKTSAVTATAPTVNAAPVVDISSPTVNASYNAPASIRLTANATVSGSSITKVEFFSGSTLITTEKTLPYDWTWTNVPAGSYSITAKAYAANGTVTTSTAVPITVKSATSTTSGPVVTLTSPLANATYTSPASIRFAANASVSGSSIYKVEFLNGSKRLCIEYHAPYEWTWTNVPAGTYSVRAVATATDGKVTWGPPITITVKSGSSAVVEPFNDNPSDSLSNFKFNVYPNPVIKNLQVQFDKFYNDEEVKIQFTNPSGVVLQNLIKRVNGKFLNLDVSSFGSGVYILSISDKQGVNSRTFIKQ